MVLDILERFQKLGSLLKERRLSISPAALSIGSHVRAPRMVGRSVTQEEFAEAVGVSRQWYSLLENGTAPRASMQLMERVIQVYGETERAELLALAVPEIVVANARYERDLLDGALRAIPNVRLFVERVATCTSFPEAAELVMETTQEILRPTCVSILSLETAKGAQLGAVLGPRSQHWRALNDHIARESQDPLRYGGVGINECLPSSEEVAERPLVQIPFTRIGGKDTEYAYGCAPQIWQECNWRLRARSVLSVPLFERERFRGVVCACWTEPRKIDALEIDVLDTLATVLELSASP